MVQRNRAAPSGPLAVTGTLPSLTRCEAKALIEAAGNKLDNAQQLSVTILDENGLHALLEGVRASVPPPKPVRRTNSFKEKIRDERYDQGGLSGGRHGHEILARNQGKPEGNAAGGR
ncbi:hypothetical protein [Sedimenticola sp.]|uniref:hypothetical protein n=1 Tax=Sedimenticola sp. TaxID=1940285 RepID=UPI0025870E13|nr:hypothetical protein [Sedimenticola sp.]MCW8903813.1 hypothetical protein [Sedimenticola sp.]